MSSDGNDKSATASYSSEWPGEGAGVQRQESKRAVSVRPRQDRLRQPLLFLHRRRRLRTDLHQSLQLCAVERETVPQRARMVQTADGERKIAYEALDNGFLPCADPQKLQHICDSLGPEDIDRMFRKWLDRIPLPLRPPLSVVATACGRMGDAIDGMLAVPSSGASLTLLDAMARPWATGAAGTIRHPRRRPSPPSKCTTGIRQPAVAHREPAARTGAARGPGWRFASA